MMNHPIINYVSVSSPDNCLGGKFLTRDITWQVGRLGNISREGFEKVMEEATAAWAAIANITFSKGAFKIKH